VGLITSKRPHELRVPTVRRGYAHNVELQALQERVAELERSQVVRVAKPTHVRNLEAALTTARRRATWLQRRVDQLVAHCRKHGLKVPAGRNRK